jgi:hypothetical protein
LALYPFGISIAGRSFAGEFEPAFGWAFDVRTKKRSCDFHKGKLLHFDGMASGFRSPCWFRLISQTGITSFASGAF